MLGWNTLIRLLTSWFRDAASKARAKQRVDRLIFPVAIPARIICALGAATFGSLAAALSLAPGTSIWARLGLAFLAIGLFHYWPWSVVLDREGVSKRNFFGVRKLMRWPEVASLTYREESEDYVLSGRDSTKIWFSPFHVDPARFEAEILKHSNVGNVEVTDPSRDPYTRRRRATL